MVQNNKTLNKIKVFIINAQLNCLMNEFVKKNAYCLRLENIYSVIFISFLFLKYVDFHTDLILIKIKFQ